MLIEFHPDSSRPATPFANRGSKALQFFERNGEVCPANWKEGAATIKATPVGSKQFFAEEYASKS